MLCASVYTDAHSIFFGGILNATRQHGFQNRQNVFSQKTNASFRNT